MKLCLECVERLFSNRDYKYFVTIKPPKENIHNISRLSEYLAKKGIRFWIVQCMSENKYEHFHGILSFPEHQTPNKGLIACVRRHVNRYMGFIQCIPISSSIKETYYYIRAPRNTQNGEYHQNDICNIHPNTDCKCFYIS